jgi:GTP-binding protein
VKFRKFVDQVTVQVRAGKGGDGCSSFRREACVEHGGPDGGDGGRGGHVIFQGDHDEDSLQRLFFEPLIRAEEGGAGRGQQMHGRDGRDLVIRVPCGTEVYDEATGERLFDIVEHGQEVIVAKGGRGGVGNIHFKTSTHQAPEECTPGKPGDEFAFRVELKLLADVGLVGFPNAGKSSLLSRISDAHPRIAAYPFTTTNPIIGTMQFPDYSQIRVADIPGLIEGAHEGVGLGIEFLKHIARSRMLLYVIDMAGTDGRDPWTDYRTLRRELRAHDSRLLKLPSLIVANKMDVDGAALKLKKFTRETRQKALPISTVDGQGLDALRARLWDTIQPVARRASEAQKPATPPPAGPVTDPQDDIISPERLLAAKFFDFGSPRSRQRR